MTAQDFAEKGYRLQVVIHRESEGYWAAVVQLPGVFAAGDTEAELMEALAEAVAMYLEETGIPEQMEAVEVKDFNLFGHELLPA